MQKTFFVFGHGFDYLLQKLNKIMLKSIKLLDLYWDTVQSVLKSEY